MWTPTKKMIVTAALILAVTSCCHAQIQVIRTENEAMNFIAQQRYRKTDYVKAEELQAIVHDLVLQPLLYSTEQLVTNETPTTGKSETTTTNATKRNMTAEPTTMTVTNVTMEPITMIVTNMTIETTMTVQNTTMEATTMMIVTEITEEPASQCFIDLETFRSDILRAEHYALMMLDSYGKIPPGILQGNKLWLGLYDQCSNQSRQLDGGRENFKAVYCLASVTEKNQPLLSVGVCVPDSCKSTDLAELIGSDSVKNVFSVSYSCSKTPDYTPAAIVCLIFLSFLGLFIMVGTMYDFLRRYEVLGGRRDGFEALAEDHRADHTINGPSSDKNVKISNGDAPISIQNIKPENERFIVKFILCFSLLINGSKILNTKQGEGSLGALNGIRVLSLWWVILGHTYIFPETLFSNPTIIVDILSRFTFQAVGNATFSVDSFFFLSGLLVTYLTLKYLRNNNGKLNWVMFYVHRYLRLTPVYMLVIFFFATLTPYLATGPIYSIVFDPNPAPGIENQLTYCQDYWWTNLLYINNLYPSSLQTECLAWSWYLANDMQFFIISPFVIYLLYHYFFAGVVAWSILLITSFGSLIGVSIKYNITTYALSLNPNVKTFGADEIYVRPWTRIPPYLVGMAVGYILYKYLGRVRMRRHVAIMGWIAATGIGLAVVYGLYGNYHGNLLSEGASVVYITLSRFSWAVALAWVAFACVTGYGGPVNSLLSWSVWIPLARISYCAYLLHPIIMFVFYYSLPTLIYFSDFLLIYFFLGHVVLSYAAAFVLSVCSEAPFMALEKLFLKRGKSV
ncbi:nose resistant to fluoxetine protein 6-like [Anneissia japonica]|uniref:nose resistant to fluoxetine protein 6-like n=1 Tax=Anneissia japonica TaxID=1529436 RepID=UPI0014258A7D|nr:nose resistant to fluoxetine protein 6-like [Anneissia japonica]